MVRSIRLHGHNNKSRTRLILITNMKIITGTRARLFDYIDVRN